MKSFTLHPWRLLISLCFTDATGKPLNALEHSYTMIFAKGRFPPVKTFWSLTMYDGKTQLLIKNPLNRYLLNSAMFDKFKHGGDDSLTFYIAKASPGTELESNWLPAPDGPLLPGHAALWS